MFWVFINTIDEFNSEAIVLDDRDEKAFWNNREELESKGVELVWDSAKTLEEAFKYAEKQYDAYPKTCTSCKSYRSVGLYRGRKYDFEDEKWGVFNGYLCDECSRDDNLFKVEFIKEYIGRSGMSF